MIKKAIMNRLISLGLGFRRNSPSVPHPNLAPCPTKGTPEIPNLTPPHSDGHLGMDGLCQTKCRQDLTNRNTIQFKSAKTLIFPHPPQRISDKTIQNPIQADLHFTELMNHTT